MWVHRCSTSPTLDELTYLQCFLAIPSPDALRTTPNKRNYFSLVPFILFLLVRSDAFWCLSSCKLCLQLEKDAYFVLSRAWDKEKILSPYEESNLRPSDSVLRCSNHWVTESPRWARFITKSIWHTFCILLGSVMSIA